MLVLGLQKFHFILKADLVLSAQAFTICVIVIPVKLAGDFF